MSKPRGRRKGSDRRDVAVEKRRAAEAGEPPKPDQPRAEPERERPRAESDRGLDGFK